ncbi:MAG: serine/threonine-protein kinase, partial [Planctomycetota bacterium]
MDGERWTRLRRLFEEASEMPDAARARFLDDACGDDVGLRREVDRMLAADTDGAVMLDAPAVASEAWEERPTGFDPTRVGRYEIVRPIASGGMGVVYEALQDTPARRVAVKMLRSGVLSESIRRRFLYEAEVLGRLRHPGIAQIYEAGVHADPSGAEAPFFAMEFVPGAHDLLTYTREQGLDLRARLALFAEVCDAIHHGHLQGVIHRDLKPANLLVDETGRPKVIDFGVARATEGDLLRRSLATQTGEIVGTLRYMSPEQLGGDPGSIDTRTDVYALGYVLYELVSGEAPYDVDGRSFSQVALAIRDATPVDPRRRVPDLPPEVAWVSLRALEKEPDRRYLSASELAADVRRILDHEPVVAGPPSTVYRLRKFVRRNRVATVAAGLVLLALTAGAGLAAAGYVEAAREAVKFRSINRVLSNVLVSVQTGVDGRDVRVVELLDRVADELETDLDGRPEVAAALHATLAESYYSLGLFVE